MRAGCRLRSDSVADDRSSARSIQLCGRPVVPGQIPRSRVALRLDRPDLPDEERVSLPQQRQLPTPQVTPGALGQGLGQLAEAGEARGGPGPFPIGAGSP